MSGFSRGINLGGWLSQYREFSEEHFSTFITEADIARIASWGLDHVRLPVDYPVIESDDAPGVPREAGYAHIDDCLRWCAAHGLSVVLDVHEAPGYTFNNDLTAATKSLNTLFDSPEAQARYIALWETLATRYVSAPVPIVFELLNEVTLPSNDKWNDLAARTHAAVRAIAPTTPIMIGGTHYNSVGGLEGLIEIDDPNLWYTFHTYEPLPFTHQNAPWVEPALAWGKSPSYPGILEGLEEFVAENPELPVAWHGLAGKYLDKAYLEWVIEPAVAFAKRTGATMYCGEFGVAEWVEPASRSRWLADITAILREHQIGFSLWSYKAMDFGVVDAAGEVADEEYLKTLLG